MCVMARSHPHGLVFSIVQQVLNEYRGLWCLDVEPEGLTWVSQPYSATGQLGDLGEATKPL